MCYQKGSEATGNTDSDRRRARGGEALAFQLPSWSMRVVFSVVLRPDLV